MAFAKPRGNIHLQSISNNNNSTYENTYHFMSRCRLIHFIDRLHNSERNTGANHPQHDDHDGIEHNA